MDVSALKVWIQESGVKIGHLEMEIKGLKEQNELLRLENNSLKSEISTLKESESKSDQSDASTETDQFESNGDNDDSAGIQANQLGTILISTYRTLINRKRQRYHSDDKIDEERNELEPPNSNTQISGALSECTNEDLIHQNGIEFERTRFLQPSDVNVRKRKLNIPQELTQARIESGEVDMDSSPQQLEMDLGVPDLNALTNVTRSALSTVSEDLSATNASSSSTSTSTSEFVPGVSKRIKRARLDIKEGQSSNSSKGRSFRTVIANGQIEKFKDPGFVQSATIWGKIQVGEPVFAYYPYTRNKSYYPGRITKKGLDNTWYAIHFENNKNFIMSEGLILPIKILGHGTRAVYCPSDSFEPEDVIVVGQKLADAVEDVEYAVVSEVDGRRIYCFRRNLSLKETVAKVLLRNNIKRTEQNYGDSDNDNK